MNEIGDCMGGETYAGGGIGRRAGNKRGVHNGLQLMGIADMTAECTMCGDKSTPGILRSRKAVEHGRMRSTTRKSIPKMYEGCKTCPNNISGYGKCKIKFDNFYYRKGKNNHCCHCQEEIKKWHLGF